MIGGYIVQKNPKAALQLFQGVMGRVNKGIYYGVSNKADVFCFMAYHTAASIIPAFPEEGNSFLATIRKKSSTLFNFTVYEEELPLTIAKIEANIKFCTVLTRICVLFKGTIEMEEQQIISQLMNRILKLEQSQKDHALKELFDFSVQNKMGLIFHRFTEQDNSKLHDSISTNQWIHMFLEGQSEENKQEILRAVQS